MKRKLFLMLMVAVFALAACVKETTDGGKSEGTAWFAVSISTPTPTRGFNDPDIDYGTIDESHVNNAFVLLFGEGENPTCLQIHEFVWNKAAGMVVSQPFLVDKNSKQLLVVLNPATEFPRDAGQPYSYYNAVMGVEVSKVTMFNGFMMTNASGMLAGNIQDYLRPTEVGAAHTPFHLEVDRVVAKVRVYRTLINTRNINNYANLFNIDWLSAQWGLNVTNKVFYPLSERIATAKNSDVWSNRGGTYRIDPNYYTYTGQWPNWNPNFNSPSYSDFFNWDGANGNYDINFKPFTTESSGKGDMTETNIEYCLENTFDELSSFHAWTTHAVIKIQLAPTGIPTDESWFSIADEYFTISDLVSRMEYEDNNGIPPYAQSISPLVQDFLEKFALDLDNVSTWSKGYSDGIVNFYHQGWNYYKIMIKHDNYDDPGFVNQLGEYGVVRNSVYDINIQGINNPGYPVIPDPDPETPNELDQKWLSVKIDINPWTWYTQNEVLE